MPRQADPDSQRALIAEALWRLASETGLGSVTLRQVAAEAGVSMGRVQHYFASKADMLLFGLRLAQQRMEERIQARLSSIDDETGSEEILRAALEEMLGEHPDTRQAIRVSMAFQTQALHDAGTAAVLTTGDDELRQLAADAVQTAQRAGRAPSSVDAEQEARILWLLAPSLGSGVALGHLSISEARDTLAYYLDRLLGQRAN